MPRLKELRRIEAALKTNDVVELEWARKYAATRIETASSIGLPPKAVARANKTWGKRLADIELALAEAKRS